MILQHVLSLVNAGYSKDEINAMITNEEHKPEPNEEPKPEPKPEPKVDEVKPFVFDYAKMASAMLEAQQAYNRGQNFGGTNQKDDIGKLF